MFQILELNGDTLTFLSIPRKKNPSEFFYLKGGDKEGVEKKLKGIKEGEHSSPRV